LTPIFETARQLNVQLPLGIFQRLAGGSELPRRKKLYAEAEKILPERIG
jgi:hypothetical protein